MIARKEQALFCLALVFSCCCQENIKAKKNRRKTLDKRYMIWYITNMDYVKQGEQVAPLSLFLVSLDVEITPRFNRGFDLYWLTNISAVTDISNQD